MLKLCGWSLDNCSAHNSMQIVSSFFPPLIHNQSKWNEGVTAITSLDCRVYAALWLRAHVYGRCSLNLCTEYLQPRLPSRRINNSLVWYHSDCTSCYGGNIISTAVKRGLRRGCNNTRSHCNGHKVRRAHWGDEFCRMRLYPMHSQ